MQTTTITLPAHVAQKTLTLSRGEISFPDSLDSLKERLEIILDDHRFLADDLSNELFCWGSRTLTLFDDDCDIGRLKEAALKRLGGLEELLISTQIDLKAEAAKLPLELKINRFAKEMFNWMKDAQKLFDYDSKSEIVISLQKINLTLIPTPIAVQMYHHLKSNQEKIEEAKAERSQLKITAVDKASSLSDVRKSLMEEIREAKAKMASKLAELEELTSLKIEVMEERHQIEMEFFEFRLKNAESDLKRCNMQLAYSERNNDVNDQKISKLNEEMDRLKRKINDLEDELDDGGGCILS